METFSQGTMEMLARPRVTGSPHRSHRLAVEHALATRPGKSKREIRKGPCSEAMLTKGPTYTYVHICIYIYIYFFFANCNKKRHTLRQSNANSGPCWGVKSRKAATRHNLVQTSAQSHVRPWRNRVGQTRQERAVHSCPYRGSAPAQLEKMTGLALHS